MVSVSSEATAGLRRARQMMATELEKGEKTLADTGLRQWTNWNGIQQSKHKAEGYADCDTIEWQTFMDRIILWSGFSIFLLVDSSCGSEPRSLVSIHYYKWWNKDDGVVETVETIDVELIVPSDVDVPPSIENAALLIEGGGLQVS